MIDRTGSFTVSKSFRVKDWPKGFKINAPFRESGATFTGNVTGLKCDGVAGERDLRMGGGTMIINLDENGDGTVPGALGPSHVHLDISGGTATLQFRNQYAQQELAVMPGDFCNN